MTKIDYTPKLINIDLDKIQRLEVLSFSLSPIKVKPRFIYAVNLFLIMYPEVLSFSMSLIKVEPRFIYALNLFLIM